GDRPAAHRRGDGRRGARGAERHRCAARPAARGEAGRGSAADAELRGALLSRHRRLAGRRGGQARVLASLPRLGRLVRGSAAVLVCASMARILVVANRTAESPELLEALKTRAAQGDDPEFLLVVPAGGKGIQKAADPDAAR